jgi:phosphate transport system substrate-binding protein
MPWAIRGLSAGLLAAAVTACGGSSGAQGQITIDGSSTVYPITEAVAEEFQKVQPQVRVTVGLSGTGGGFQKLCRGEIEIGGASRPVRPPELQACTTGGVPFLELPVAYDGLAVVVNPKNTWVDHLTVAELRRLWEPAAEGKVMRWSQVRAGWPDREVRLFGPGVDSGTFDYFTDAINGKEKASRGDYTSSEDDNVLVQGVAGDQDALGYFGYAYFEENQGRLKLVPVDDQNDDNGKGPIAPSPEAVRGGTYRPLSRPLFIYVSEAALGRPEVKAFVDFYLESGSRLTREVGYVPLTDRERELVAQRYAAGRTGTLFGTPGASSMPLEQLLSR